MSDFFTQNASATFALIGTFFGSLGGFIAKWLLEERNYKKDHHKELLRLRREIYAKVLEAQLFVDREEFGKLYKNLGLAIIVAGSNLAISLEALRENIGEFLILYNSNDIEGVSQKIQNETEARKQLSKKIRDEMRIEICG